MKYTVFGVEEVYDAFDVFEHSNALAPVVIEASSIEDARREGANALTNDIRAARAGFRQSGDFVSSVTQIIDSDGYLVYQDTSGMVRGLPFPSDERSLGLLAAGLQTDTRTCFLSYNSEDTDFVRVLFNELLTHRFLCWFAPERPEMPSIDRIDNETLELRLTEAIYSSRVVLVIISDHSIKSRWVNFEVSKAIEKNRSATIPQLIGLRIEESNVAASWILPLIKNHLLLDFKNWRDGHWFSNRVAELASQLTAMFVANSGNIR